MPPVFFEISPDQLTCLATRDKKLGRLIERVGVIKREIIPDAFTGLVRAIIAQQISNAALASVWNRFKELQIFTPELLAETPNEKLQSCGISRQKTIYIKGIAQAFTIGQLSHDKLACLDEQSLLETLCAYKGIGQWTAEMLMIFTFQKKNVLSYGDGAIRKGLRMLYLHREITPALFEKYKKRYRPNGSIASLYLWELASGKYSEYSDPAQ